MWAILMMLTMHMLSRRLTARLCLAYSDAFTI